MFPDFTPADSLTARDGIPPCVIAPARAQQGERVRRLVAMMGGRNADTDPEGRAWFVAFRKALEDLGWVEGRNFRADYRWPSGDIDRIEVIAKEFIDLKPDVMLAGN